MTQSQTSTYKDVRYLVGAEAWHGDRLFRDAEDYGHFLALFGSTAERYGWCCHAYCLLPTAFYLLLQAPAVALALGLEALHGSYSLAFTRRHAARGHVYSGEHRICVIRTADELKRATCITLDAPRRAGLAALESWPWSSAAAQGARHGC